MMETTASQQSPPCGEATDQSPEAVRSMFAGITPTYDRLNHLFSAAMDRRWRAAAARELTNGLEPCRRILDVATGTGDLAAEVRKTGSMPRVTGLDFTRPMLQLAGEKFGRTGFDWIEGDGLRLPFASGAFDAACIAFGLRNMADRTAGLAEMRRVTRPGGRVAILEFSQPAGLLRRRLYDFYSFSIMPRLGRWISGSDAYLYLSRSIREFWSPERLREEMMKAGLGKINHRSMAGGVVALHVGEVL